MIAKHLQEVLQNSQIVDKFVNGECSKCGECCSRYLPVSNKELKIIKKFIKGKNLKIAPESFCSCFGITKNFFCPFMDWDATNKCQIYSVRPAICKLYSCHKHAKSDFSPIAKLKNLKLTDLYSILEN